MTLQEQLCEWETLRLAYDKAARGKRGRAATAAFEFDLADQLLASVISQQGKELWREPGQDTMLFTQRVQCR